jgi:hypothetical protein
MTCVEGMNTSRALVNMSLALTAVTSVVSRAGIDDHLAVALSATIPVGGALSPVPTIGRGNPPLAPGFGYLAGVMSDATPIGAAIAEMLEALQLERAELRARLGPLGDHRRVRVIRGTRILAEPSAHTYRFDCTLDLPVPDGTAVRLDADGEASGGEVLRFDRDAEVLIVVLKQDLGDTVPEGWVSFDPSLLLDLIAGRLRLIANEESDAALGPAFNPELGLVR